MNRYKLKKDLPTFKAGDEYWSIDEQCAEFGNVFKTKQDAKKAVEWLKAVKVLREDADGYSLGVVLPYVVAHYNHAKDLIERHRKEWLTFFGVSG